MLRLVVESFKYIAAFAVLSAEFRVARADVYFLECKGSERSSDSADVWEHEQRIRVEVAENGSANKVQISGSPRIYANKNYVDSLGIKTNSTLYTSDESVIGVNKIVFSFGSQNSWFNLDRFTGLVVDGLETFRAGKSEYSTEYKGMCHKIEKQF